MNDKACGGKTCIECRWCEMRLDLETGSGYLCSATSEPLGPGDVIRRPACGAYEPPAPAGAGYWGP